MTPAEAYIATLGSDESKATMRSALKKLASYLSALGPPFTREAVAEPESFPWEAVHGEHADYIGARIDFEFSGRTRLKYISALRGVLKQCLVQGAISAQQFEEASSMERLLISDSKSL